MFVRAITPSVSSSTRHKGLAYFAAGAVTSIDGSGWVVHATVRGNQTYRVNVTRHDDRFTASCTCPYFVDREEICKHIWAVMLAAERRELLDGDGLPLPASFALNADADAIDPAPDAPAQGSRSDRTQPRPPATPWGRLLTAVQQSLAASERATPQPRFTNGEILYAVSSAAETAPDTVGLTVQFRQRKKNGEWGKPRPVTLSAREIDQLPNRDDREILSLLMGAADHWGYQGQGYDFTYQVRTAYRLSGLMTARVLPLAVRTGRAYLAGSAPDTPAPIVWDDGGPWRFELAVTRAAKDQSVTIDGALVRDGERRALADVQLLGAGCAIAGSTVMTLDAAVSTAWLEHLRRSGPVTVPGDAAESLVEALARSGVEPSALPDDLRFEIVDGSPRPRVSVARRTGGAGYYNREDLDAVADFDYSGTLVGMEPGLTIYDASRRRLVRRDRSAEQRAVERLHELGFRQAWNYALSRHDLAVGVEQFPRAVRTLVNEGWRVEAEGRVFRAAHGIQVRVQSGIDWFELHGRVDFGEGLSAALPELLAAIRRGDATVTLDDGTKGMLPEEWLRRYAGIARFGDMDGDHVRFGASQAALLDALIAAQPAITVDAAFDRARRALRTFDGVLPLDAPPSFTGALREYQREALGWFEFLRRFGFGGCLADDMGLGKTVMVVALLEGRRTVEHPDGRRPSLAVLPRSLVFNWTDEAKRFAPGLRLLDYTGAARAHENLDDYDLVLTTYGTLRRDAPLLKDVQFDYVILDEAQAIKNAATASSKAVRLLRARHRLALSGTPIENHVGELWSLFEFLNPGFLGSAASFESLATGRSRADRSDLATLAKAVRPFILRRTKEQVAPELPARSEQTIQCALEGGQRRLYEQLRGHYRATLLKRVARNGMGRSKLQVLEALLRLRQAACHPGLVDEQRAAESSAKFDVLMPHLMEVVEEGHKALVFSQFTSLLALLRDRLDAEGIAFEYLDGQTQDRASRVERFQTDPTCQVFLISLKAGGLGLNLTEAEYVFLLDPWWNPAVEAQAIDRAHRIGQTRPVFAYRLIASETVEEKVAELQQSKRELADAILSADVGLIRDLKPEDLEWLLS
jgi:superfamily II DNA or RNA helicase